MQQIEELILLRESARKWVFGIAAGGRHADVYADAYKSRWRDMVELGWSSIAIDERYGGAELGVAGIAAVLTQLGRELVASPLLSTALVAPALIDAAGTDEQKSRWLPKLASGDVVISAAIDDAAHHHPEHLTTVAVRTTEGWRLSGEKRFVPDAMLASHFIVAATIADCTECEIGLFIIPSSSLKPVALDLVGRRDFGRVALMDLDVSASDRLGDGRDSSMALQNVLDVARIGLSAEMLGMAEQALKITTEYLCAREQFGQPIGAFQALQHRAAKAFIEIELARTCLEEALESADGDQVDLAQLASLTKSITGNALHLMSNEIIQMHGGIGMTDEHVAGHYLKQARVMEALYGNSAYHCDRYARLCNF